MLQEASNTREGDDGNLDWAVAHRKKKVLFKKYLGDITKGAGNSTWRKKGRNEKMISRFLAI